MTYSPVAIFVFKRPEHTKRTLESLAANPEFPSSPLYIYCDGARNESERAVVESVRQIVRDFPHPQKIVVESQTNLGLARSIVAGVTELCANYGRVIVVEDDLVVSPVFLDYMNVALERYADDQRVMQISGHMFPVDLPAKSDALFLPFTTSWGWATWHRAWGYMQESPVAAKRDLKSVVWRFRFDINGVYPYSRMLSDRLKRKNNSWAVWWYYQVYARRGMTLYPRVSLVNNDGFDGSGTHCGSQDLVHVVFGSRQLIAYPEVEFDNKAINVVRSFLFRDRGFARNIYDNIWRLLARSGA